MEATTKTTVVWGRYDAVLEQVDRHGAVMQRAHPNDWAPGDYHETAVAPPEAGIEDDEPVSWHGATGRYCVVEVEY